MVVAYEILYRIRKGHQTENIRPNAGVLSHLLFLPLGERGRFVEDVFGNRQLADIVHQRGCPQPFNFIFVSNPAVFSQPKSQGLDPLDVAMSFGVLGVDGHGQRFNGRLIEFVELADVLVSRVDAVQIDLVSVVDDQDDRCGHGDGKEGSFLKKEKDQGRSRGAGKGGQGNPQEV